MLTLPITPLHSLTPDKADGQASAPTQVCIPNIDTAGRRQRLMAGIVEAVIGVGILAVLLAVHANPLWRVPLLLVFWGAAISFYQWRDHT